MASGNPYLDDAPAAPSGANPYLDDTPAPASTPEKPASWGFREYATDGVRSLLSGVGKGVAGVVGLPADALRLGQAGLDYSQSIGQGRPFEAVSSENRNRGAIGIPDAVAQGVSAGARTLGSENIAANLPTQYEPQTRAGNFISEAANFATQGAALPLGIARGAAAGVGAVSGLASEGAGQVAQAVAPAAEPYARLGGALAGGIGAAVAQAPSATQRAVVREASQIPREELAPILDRAQGLLDDAAANGTKLSTFQAIDMASGGRLNTSEIQRHAEGMGRLRSFFADIGDTNRDAARGQFARVGEDRADASALGREVSQAAGVAIERTPEGARLNAAQAALGPRVEAREAGEAMRSGLMQTEAERRAARSAVADPLYDRARNAPNSVSVDNFVNVERPGRMVARQPDPVASGMASAAERPAARPAAAAPETAPSLTDEIMASLQANDQVGEINLPIRDIKAIFPGVSDAELQEAIRPLRQQGLATFSQFSDPKNVSRNGHVAWDLGAGDVHTLSILPAGRTWSRAAANAATPEPTVAAAAPIMERGPNVVERVNQPRAGQVDPTAALAHIDEAITNAKGDQLTALRRARRTLFDANGEMDLTSAGNMSAAQAIQSIADKAMAAGDRNTARLMGSAKTALGEAMESTPEIATANREFARLSRPLDNFDSGRPVGRIVERDQASGRPAIDAESAPGQIQGSTGAREFNEAATPAAREAYRGRLTTQMIDEAGGREASAEAIRATLAKNADLLREHPTVVARLQARAEADEGMTAVRNGPLGRLVDRNQTASEAAAKLFPTGESAMDFSPQEVGRAVAALAAENPRAAGTLVRTRLEGAFNTVAKDVIGFGGEQGAAKFRNAIYGNTRQAEQIREAVRALPDGETVLNGLDRLFDVFQAQGLRQNVGSKTAYNGPALEALGRPGAVLDVASDALRFKLPTRFGTMMKEWAQGRRMDQIAALVENPDARAAFRGLLRSGDISGPVGRLATIAARSQSGAPLQISVQPRGQD